MYAYGPEGVLGSDSDLDYGKAHSWMKGLLRRGESRALIDTDSLVTTWANEDCAVFARASDISIGESETSLLFHTGGNRSDCPIGLTTVMRTLIPS